MYIVIESELHRFFGTWGSREAAKEWAEHHLLPFMWRIEEITNVDRR